MKTKNIYPSFLDPRTKILIWLLANVVVFTWSPAVFQLGVMVAYLILFLVERKGTMLGGLLATYLAMGTPCHLCYIENRDSIGHGLWA